MASSPASNSSAWRFFRQSAASTQWEPAHASRLLVASGYLLVADACYLIATSRWGSYVGVPHRPVYIGDVLFGACLVCWTLGGGVARLWRGARRSPLLWVVLALVAWTLVRLASGTVNTVALRDAAPYLYLLAIPVAMTTPISRRVVFAMVLAALAFHTIWVTLGIEYPSLFAGLPNLGRTQMFASRPDFDEAIAGVAMGVGVVGTVRARGWLPRLAWLALAAVSTWDLAHMGSRGGLLAGLACLVVAAIGIVWEQARSPLPRGRRAGLAAAGVGLSLAAVVGVLQSPAVNRLNNSFAGPAASAAGAPAPTPRASHARSGTGRNHGTQQSTGGRGSAGKRSTRGGARRTSAAARTASATSANADTAAGTTRARKLAWKDVYRYTTATPARAAFGVGFGPNFLQAAGAYQALSGGVAGLRAPHNILLNTWARLGAVGLALHIALLALALLLAARYVRRRGMGSELSWALLVLAVPITAMVGVILESPFAALPYAYAVGRLWRSSFANDRAQAWPDVADPNAEADRHLGARGVRASARPVLRDT